MMKLWTALLTVLLLLYATYSFAARTISLPYSETFDVDNYSAEIATQYVNGGATFTHMTTGCYSGGCAKLTPPTDCATGGAAAIGSHVLGTQQSTVFVRFLVKFGTTWWSTASACGGEGLGVKFVQLWNTNSERMIAGLLTDSHIPGIDPDPFGICSSYNGTNYNCDNAAGGAGDCAGGYPSNKHEVAGCGYDRIHIGGNGATDHDNEWISVELEANAGGYNKIYITTQDGVHTGLYVTAAGLQDGGLWDNISHIGGYYNQDHPTADANTYMLIDELAISTSYIGPPAGFVGSRKLNNVTGVRVTLY